MEDIDMASKKAYFFKLDIIDKNNSKCDYHLIQSEIMNIINENAYVQDNYKSLDLTVTRTELHNIMDIFEYEKTRLFCRLSKQKPGNEFIGREYHNYKKADIVDSNDHQNFGIEQYTFAMLNYETGVVCIVSAQGAPNEKAFIKMFEKFSENYKLELTDILNEHGIEKIYNGTNPEIMNFEIEVPLPKGSMLENVFGWNLDEIIDSVEDNNLKVSVTVKSNYRRGVVTESEGEVKKIINKIKEKCRNIDYTKAKMKAKTKNIKAREYNFYEENFSYPIDITNYHIENYTKVYFTVDELVDIYRNNLLMAYNESIELINMTIGRKE